MARESLRATYEQNMSSAVGFVDKVVILLGTVFFFLLPSFYLTSTTEFTEYPKLVLTLFFAVSLLAAWGVKVLVARRITIVKTPFNLSLILLVIAVLLSTIFSVSQFVSLYGQFNVWHFTLPELVAFVMIFFVLSSVEDTKQAFRKYLFGFIFGATVVSLLVLLSYGNVFDGIAQEGTRLSVLSVLAVDGFSPAGNTLSTWYVLAIGVILLGSLAKLSFHKDGSLASVLPVLGSISIAKVFVYISLGITIMALLVTVSSYIPGAPVRFAVPAQLSLSESWRIASSAIRDNALFGTGPSTYNTAYNAYRSVQMNQGDEWNVAFHRAGNEYFTWLTTTGLVGVVLLLYFAAKVLRAAKRSLLSRKSQAQVGLPLEGEGIRKMRATLAMLVVGTLIAYVFTASTLVIMGVFFLIMILWMLAERVDDRDSMVSIADVNLEIVTDRLNMQTPRSFESSAALPFITGLLFIVISVIGGWYVLQDFRSNLAFAESLQLLVENKPARDIYNAQREAIALNNRRDAYRRAYANTNISTAQAIAAERGETITDSERQDVIQLVQQALREVRIATELLNRYSAQNWQIRGRIYQNLLGVAQGADRWALQAYQQAILLAPQDPQLRIDLGGLYFALATTNVQPGDQGDAPGENVPTVPETKQANLLRAISAFQDAVRLKADLANAHFNLAAAYKEAGRTDLALQELQTTQSLLEEGNEDYKRVSEEIAKLQVSPTPTPAVSDETPAISPSPTPTPTVGLVTPTPVFTITPTPAQ